jgi:hypothetical protein
MGQQAGNPGGTLAGARPVNPYGPTANPAGGMDSANPGMGPRPVITGPSQPIGPGVPTTPTGPITYNPPPVGGSDSGGGSIPVGAQPSPYKPGPPVGGTPSYPGPQPTPTPGGIKNKQLPAPTLPNKRFPPIR